MTTPENRTIAIPQVALVVLVGVSGSGKSTFAREKFGRYEVVSSDFCRGLVSDDENDQSATRDAFDVLGYIVGKRLAAGRLTVVDATNVQLQARRVLVDLARAHDVLPVAIVLDLPERVCLERNVSRADRTFGPEVVRRQQDQLRRSIKGLNREGFRKVHVLRSVEEIESAVIVREKLLNDYRHLIGPFDIIGDLHGCRSELESLLGALGYEVVADSAGRSVDAQPPAGRTAVFVGDLVDRGPDSPGVLRLVMGMVAAGHALAVPGNHEHKLIRALRGRNVKVSHGLQETLTQLDAEPAAFRKEVEEFCDGLVSHLVLDAGRLVVAHAGLKEVYHGRASGRVRSFALYGDTTGETDEYGLPVRYPWATDYRGAAVVLYGHTPTVDPQWVNNTFCLDTGCVFGGGLTAMRYPEKQVVAVPAERVWYEPVRPLTPAAPATPEGETETSGSRIRDRRLIGRAAGDDLSLGDVMGVRAVETRYHGRIKIRAENAAGALEVMSRFALEPNWLRYLPPTMAPTSTSARADMLEHPAEAFAAYRADGVGTVMCQEKHMGSRAVVLVARSAEAARHAFGGDGARTGVVHTRTGRSFFPGAVTEKLLTGVREAVTEAGLWAEMETDWLLLDCELLPWSAKAEGLLRGQYAAVGAAARAALTEVLPVLRQAADSGLDVADLLGRSVSRLANAEKFTAAYRRYCWPTHGLEGVRVAPFQLLATTGTTHHRRDHGWHLAIADRLVAAAPDLFQATGRLVVETGDPQSSARGEAWWTELTEAGGEGMVVKPFENLVRGRKSLAQPGIKVRGREYLRLIYGPDYTEPASLERLRTRNVGHKRSMALREYALGLEALERGAGAEPLWRVHEAVFGVLALESEPVDPRL